MTDFENTEVEEFEATERFNRISQVKVFFRNPSLDELLKARREGYKLVRTPHLHNVSLHAVIDAL
jgi:hypothetical protein